MSITANEAYTLDNGILYFAPNASGTVVAKYTYFDSNGDQENVTLTASASTFIDFGPVNTASTLLNLSEYFIYSTESYMNYENCVNAMYKYTANITYTKLLNAAVEATKKAYADLQPGPSNVIKVIDNDWKGRPSSDYTPESFADFTVKLNAIKADINESGVTLDDLRNDYKAYLSISSILKETLNDFKRTLSTTTYTYNGNAKTPSLKIYNSYEKLVNGKDYTFKYVNNINPGIASVSITGIGPYGGTYTINFNIKPNKVGLSQPKAGSKKLMVKWKKVVGDVSYQIGYKKAGSSWNYKNAGGTSITLKGLAKKKKYRVKVRAIASGVYGSWSSTKTVKVK